MDEMLRAGLRFLESWTLHYSTRWPTASRPIKIALEYAARVLPRQPERGETTPPRTSVRLDETGLTARAHRASETTARWLLSQQHPEGCWVGELEADTTLESDYIILLWYLGNPHPEKLPALARYLKRRQGEDGGWNIYPGGPSEVSATVKAYLALKLAGEAPSAPHMVRARDRVLQLGGMQRANSFTKAYLALLGEYDWRHVPAIPPEMILLPTWFPFNVYEMSAWTRTIVVPLSILWALRPLRPVPPGCGVQELVLGGPSGMELPMRRDWVFFTWRNIFLWLDGALKLAEAVGHRFPFKPIRRLALRRAEAWILKRLVKTDGLGAIFPAMVNAVMALRALGYPEDHPRVVEATRQLEGLEIPEGDTLRLQPCFSPVWDTGIAVIALREAGLAEDHPALVRAARWLLSKEVRSPGDWSVHRRGVHPGGWYFEYNNEFYPDVDDTAMVLMALQRVRPPEGERVKREAEARALRWLLAMQNPDGGWASFDAENTRQVLTKIPFADHNAMLDPSTADITGRVLEMLAGFHFRYRDRRVQKALRYLRSQQEPDGAWYGRWGVNYLYGTWQVLKGLRTIGERMDHPWCRRAADWIRSCRNPDGGWGESCASYEDPTLKGIGPSTASQTAWALMGLFACGDFDGPIVRGGLEYLLRTQKADGTWDEAWFTGTGFPRVFYLKYHLYRTVFPLFALGWYLRARGEEELGGRSGAGLEAAAGLEEAVR